MTHDQFLCNHDWEQVWSAEDHYMHCLNCGTTNPLGLFQTVDFAKPGTPVYAAKPGEIKRPGWNVRPGRSWNPELGQYPPHYKISGGKIRTCKVWKAKTTRILDGILRAFLHSWRWRCRLCGLQGQQPTWKHAYAWADQHAHNHHRSYLAHDPHMEE